MTTRRPAILLAAMLAASFAVAGCGGSEPLEEPSSVLRLRVDEYRIVPDHARVRAGRLKIMIYDAGILTHNVKVESDEIDPEGKPVVVGGTPTAHPGETQFGKVELEPGTYRLACTIANHDTLGMYGKLEVVGPASGSSGNVGPEMARRRRRQARTQGAGIAALFRRPRTPPGGDLRPP